MKKKYEYVNHPTHYNHEGRKECWDEWVEKFGVDAAVVICLGNADKYLYRAGTKKDNPAKQDIEKARMYFKKAGDIIVFGKSPVAARTGHMYNIVGEELMKYDNL